MLDGAGDLRRAPAEFENPVNFKPFHHNFGRSCTLLSCMGLISLHVALTMRVMPYCMCCRVALVLLVSSKYAYCIVSNINTSSLSVSIVSTTPNANMADHWVIARDELHESEASEASVFCFDNASPEKSCFVDGLVCFLRYAY